MRGWGGRKKKNEQRRGERKKLQTGKRERVEEALNQETERSRPADEKQNSGGPQGSGSMCRHNEQSQTYPASLISTIKAPFSARHAACYFTRLQKALTCHLRSKQLRRSARLEEPRAGGKREKRRTLCTSNGENAEGTSPLSAAYPTGVGIYILQIFLNTLAWNAEKGRNVGRG